MLDGLRLDFTIAIVVVIVVETFALVATGASSSSGTFYDGYG